MPLCKAEIHPRSFSCTFDLWEGQRKRRRGVRDGTAPVHSQPSNVTKGGGGAVGEFKWDGSRPARQ